VVALLAVLVRPTSGSGVAPEPIVVTVRTTSYRWPARRPILDGWRAPANPFGPGNRGLELATIPGDPIVSPQAGTVTFAGPVAGTRYLVIAHGDGFRTTLGGLAAIEVRVGRPVRRGQRVASAGGPTHFGIRYGDTYVDPTPLLAGDLRTRSWLVADERAEPEKPAALLH
jgi:murein DD-endopeptidase MepM/ murein hydrolase activator NlpD